MMPAGMALTVWTVLCNSDIHQHQSPNTSHLSTCLQPSGFAAFRVEYLVSQAKSLPRCVHVFAAIEGRIAASFPLGIGQVAVSEQGWLSRSIHSAALLTSFTHPDIYGGIWGFPV